MEDLRIENVFGEYSSSFLAFNGIEVAIKNSTFINCPESSCVNFYTTPNQPSRVEIDNVVFDGGAGSALLTFGEGIVETTVRNSYIKNNFDYFGFENYTQVLVVDVRENYWGDPSGPYHETLNPTGLGAAITNLFDNVVFTPWLTSYPPVTCCSNVMFLPGVLSSRLYEPGLECGDVFTGNECGEKELWVSVSDLFHQKLALGADGKTLYEVYTKDDTENSGEEETGIIDELGGVNIYNSFIDELREWKTEQIIADYAFIPYDWRLSLADIVTNGKAGSGKLSYTTAQDFSESFILQKLQSLQQTSKSGKVTIIAHSNGGLVTKALMEKLKDTGNPLYEKIDKIIFVGVPQVGTPDTVMALLHGTGIGPGGFIMSGARMRWLAENMPAIYNLLPSESYFSTVLPGFANNSIASFPNDPLFDDQVSKYDFFVSDYAEIEDYILGAEGRSEPAFDDTVHPAIGNPALYFETEAVHAALDAWLPPASTQIIQVAGWGEETIAGIDYGVYQSLFGGKKISYKPRFVVDGDGTVVTPSALWMSDSAPNVERWWVNLEEYNNRHFFNIKHKNVLEIANLLGFFKSKISDSEFSDPENIIVNDSSTLISSDGRLHFTLHSPLTLGIKDSQGRYTGLDPVTGEVREEIPGVLYRQLGEVQFISVPIDVQYTLVLDGYADGDFSLDVDFQTGNEITESISFQGISSSEITLGTMAVDSDILSSELQVDEDSNGDVDKIYQIVDGEMQTTDLAPVSENTSISSSGSSGSRRRAVENDLETEPVVEGEVEVVVADILPEAKQQNEAIIDADEVVEDVEQTENNQNPSLLASARNTGFSGNWITYGIILSVLGMIFVARKFIYKS